MYRLAECFIETCRTKAFSLREMSSNCTLHICHIIYGSREQNVIIQKRLYSGLNITDILAVLSNFLPNKTEMNRNVQSFPDTLTL